MEKVNIDIQKINELCRYADTWHEDRGDTDFMFEYSNKGWGADKELLQIEQNSVSSQVEKWILRRYKETLAKPYKEHCGYEYKIPENFAAEGRRLFTIRQTRTFSDNALHKLACEFAVESLGYKSISDYCMPFLKQDLSARDEAQKNHDEFNQVVMIDMHSISEFIENEEQRKKAKKLKQTLSNAKEKYEHWFDLGGANPWQDEQQKAFCSCPWHGQREWIKSPLEHSNKKGERHFEIRRLYDQKMKELSEKLEKEYVRIDTSTAELEAEPLYEALEKQVLARREVERIAEEKKKLAKEKREANLRAKKRASEKKEFVKLMKRLDHGDGKGVGELNSKGKEKKSYPNEKLAQLAAIERTKRSGQYITIYSKEYTTPNGEDTKQAFTRWFLTSNKSKTAA